VARTQAVFYRDERGVEPVDLFINDLPPRRAAKIDAYVEEHLNGMPPDAPPPPFPITSQIDGDLRELRVRSPTRAIGSSTSAPEISSSCCTRSRSTPGPCRGRTSIWPSDGWRASSVAWTRSGGCPRARLVGMRRRRPGDPWRSDLSVWINSSAWFADAQVSPVGTRASAAARARARRSQEYREAHDEYAEIRELREKNWIAAHIRERRYELGLTQQQVAERAGTSHSFISKLERGDHIPTIPVLQRVLRVLDEELLIGIERRGDDDLEREVAPVPSRLTA
jgi:ribosome-binding protein aMBF1 (putative translation factor)